MGELKKGFSKLLSISIFSSIIILILGILLLIKPDAVIHMISTIIGILILIPGINSLINYFKTKYQPNLIIGIITSIIGIVLIFNSTFVASLLPFVLGVFFIVNGVNKIQYAMELKRQNVVNYTTSLVISILIVICGVLFIVNPFRGAMVITQVIGVFMVVYSVLDISNSIIIKKDMKNIFKK